MTSNRQTRAAGASQPDTEAKELGIFGRYLTVWVALCIVAGVALGQWIPAVPETLARFTVAQVNLPVAVLIWAMIFPMMLQA